MKQILFLILVASMIAVVGCDDDLTIFEPPPRFFSGTVIDSTTQLPLDSVAISVIDTIGNPLTYTDSLGEFDGIRIGDSIIVFYVQKEGYFTISRAIDLVSDADSIFFELVKQ